MDREYIRQVESPITPPQNRHAFWEEGSWLQDNVSYVEKGDGGGDRQSGWIGKVGGGGGREKVRGEKVGKDSNSDCKGLSQRSASGIFLLTFLCVWTFVHLLPTFSLSSPSPSILFIPLLFLVEASSSPFFLSLPFFFPLLFLFPLSRVRVQFVLLFHDRSPQEGLEKEREREIIDRNTVWNIRWRFISRKKARTWRYIRIQPERKRGGRRGYKWLQTILSESRPVKLCPWGMYFVLRWSDR